MNHYLRKLSEQQTLTEQEAESAMRIIMQGEARPEEIAAFLMGLRTRGETLDELVGFTRVMRTFAVPVTLDDPHAVDVVGTGGDQTGTFNISTATAFVVSGAGVTVAKHGNRSVSSKSGSADVLKALGVQTELPKAGVEFCLVETGIAFLFAPFFHPAMRHVMPVRRTLAVRTFFNILGPLCNPTGVRRLLVGAFSKDVARTMAEIFDRLDAECVLTAHADDGYDELSTTGRSTLFEVNAHQAIKEVRVHPEQHGLTRVHPDALRGGYAEENAEILRNVLRGIEGPASDVVLLNAAYALSTSGKYENLESCFEAARNSIDSGSALKKLNALIEASNAAPTE
jgi:anthranilate phosphoribosyltransferase